MGRITIQLPNREIRIKAHKVVSGFYFSNPEDFDNNVHLLNVDTESGFIQFKKVQDYCFFVSKFAAGGKPLFIAIHKSFVVSDLQIKFASDDRFKVLQVPESFYGFINDARKIACIHSDFVEDINKLLGSVINVTELTN